MYQEQIKKYDEAMKSKHRKIEKLPDFTTDLEHRTIIHKINEIIDYINKGE